MSLSSNSTNFCDEPFIQDEWFQVGLQLPDLLLLKIRPQDSDSSILNRRQAENLFAESLQKFKRRRMKFRVVNTSFVQFR